jgi:type 1 glutamine amidotransferase
MRSNWAALAVVCIAIGGLSRCALDTVDTSGAPADRPRVLVFSKTAGFRHDSIPAGVSAVRQLGLQHAFEVDSTEDSSQIEDAILARYRVVIFLNTSGDVLDDQQQQAFERFIRKGGGYLGVHAASDTEYGWPWYGQLVGAAFAGHPEVQDAVIEVVDRGHRSTSHLPARWPRRDEWYNFSKKPAAGIRVLAMLDERSYQGGTMGSEHPIAWCHEFDGGRSWYTAGGHTIESYSEPLFLEHLLGGIQWAGQFGPEADSEPPASEG